MPSAEVKEKPPFDSVIKALVFAFNAGDDYYLPSPVMNRAMAETIIAKPTKKKKKKEAPFIDGTTGEALDESPDEPKPVRGMKPPAQPGERLQGLNKAQQAGIILHTVGRLASIHKYALTAQFTKPDLKCQCQSPCCKGSKPTIRWVRAIECVCSHVKQDADILKVPGKKGLSTTPHLRRLIVERYFLQNGSSIAMLARRAKVSAITAAKHNEWITTYLEEACTEALIQIALLFDEQKITGFLE